MMPMETPPVILVVDDEEDNQRVLYEILHGYLPGVRVLAARSAEEGLEMAKKHAPDCIILDVQLPGMDGIRVCRRLKAHPATADLPVLLITAHQTSPRDKSEGLLAGAADFITKPIDNLELVSRVKVLLRVRRVEEELRRAKEGLEALVEERTSALVHSHRLLEVANQNLGIAGLLAQAEAEIRRFTQAAHVGILLAEDLSPESRKPDQAESRLCCCVRSVLLREALPIPGVVTDHGSVVIDQLSQQGSALRSSPGASCCRCPEEGFESVAVIPLRYEDEILGAIRLGDPRPQLLADSQREALEMSGIQLGVALERLRARERELQVEQRLLQSQKLEAVGQLAGGVAHDFNNLLGAILGFSDLLAEQLPTDSPLVDDVQQIARAAERGASLTRRLLTFSHRQPVVPDLVEVNQVIREFDRLVRRLLDERIELRLELSDEELPIWADGIQLDQILFNLVLNARDAMPDGGCIRIETGRVDLSPAAAEEWGCRESGPHARIRVIDTGTGIQEAIRTRIFEPFFTTKEEAGTGLGLSTVHGTVVQLGGGLRLDSRIGEGTTFEVFLALRDGDESPPRSDPPKPSKTSRPRTVLLAEDDEVVRELVSRLLEGLGHRVLVASDGDQALRILRDFPDPIDILVSDVIMPGTCGGELIRQVRAQRGELPILLMSGYLDGRLEVEDLGQGTNLLRKPFSRVEFAAELQRLLPPE